MTELVIYSMMGKWNKLPCKDQMPSAIILLAVDLLDNHPISSSWPGKNSNCGPFPQWPHRFSHNALSLQPLRDTVFPWGSEGISIEITWETLIKEFSLSLLQLSSFAPPYEVWVLLGTLTSFIQKVGILETKSFEHSWRESFRYIRKFFYQYTLWNWGKAFILIMPSVFSTPTIFGSWWKCKVI